MSILSDSNQNFKYHPKLGGVFAPGFQIVPYPTPIMRRQALRDVLSNLDAKKLGKKYIEMGYGSGIFAYEFYQLGFDVAGYEMSKNAYDTANAIFNIDKQRLRLLEGVSDDDIEAYDILGAYEVLEHIKDDEGVLRDWHKLLRDGGLLLISVPAHMRNFGLRDKWAGHVRRYEKEQLGSLLSNAGFDDIKIISYGFPLPKLMNWATGILVDKPHLKRMEKADDAHKTSVSGVERTDEFRFNKALPYRLLVLFSKIQRWFYYSDLGVGYIATARKVAN